MATLPAPTPARPKSESPIARESRNTPSPPCNDLTKSNDSNGKCREYDNHLIYVYLDQTPLFTQMQKSKDEVQVQYQKMLNSLHETIKKTLAEMVSSYKKELALLKGGTSLKQDPLDTTYALNLGIAKDGGIAPWAYIYFTDIRVSHLLLGKDIHGETRMSYIDTFYKKPVNEYTQLEIDYCDAYNRGFNLKKFNEFHRKYKLSWVDLEELENIIEGSVFRRPDRSLPPIVAFPYRIEGAYYYKAFETCRTNVIRVKSTNGSIPHQELINLFAPIHPIEEEYPQVKDVESVSSKGYKEHTTWIIFDPLMTHAGDIARTVFGKKWHQFQNKHHYLTINHPSYLEYENILGKKN